MSGHRPRRSALYMPASNPRAVEKARSLPCDAVILDLEDAVGPDDKAQARVLAVEAVQAGGFGHRELVVRINGLDTAWGEEDLLAMATAAPPAVLVPKVSTPGDLARVAHALPERTRLWAMIETCQAILKLDALGAASGVARADVWVIGANDLMKEMRCRPAPDRGPLMPALMLSITAARAHGLAVLDAVFNDIGDAEGFAQECAQGAALGFDGKSLIHPSQLGPANAAFAPEREALAWARTVAAAFDAPENAGKGVLKVEGRMVERLHLEEARRLLTVAEAIAGLEG